MPGVEKAVNLGIVGCGKAAEQLHLPALLGLPNVRVVAAADVLADRVNHLADRMGIEYRFTDYRALLDCATVDAVAVLTPTAAHAEVGFAALDADKHVLIDKPLALTCAECDRLIERAARSSRVALVGFNMRWHRLIRRARELVQSGRLGEIKAIRSVYTHWHPGETAPAWHRQRELGGGVVLNDAVHHFDLWRFLLGAEITEVCSIGRSDAHYQDETNSVTARLSNGAVGSAVFSFVTAPDSHVEIYGKSGRLFISLCRFDGLEFFPTSTYAGDVKHRIARIGHIAKELPQIASVVRRGGDSRLMYTGQWQHFVDCILRDKPPESTLQDGKRAVQATHAVLESISSGRAVPVDGW